jgi:signal transduction histidine kinase
MQVDLLVLSSFRFLGLAILIAPLYVWVLHPNSRTPSVRSWSLGHVALGFGLILISMRQVAPFWLTYYAAHMVLGVGFTGIVWGLAHELGGGWTRPLKWASALIAGIYVLGGVFHVALDTGVSARLLHNLVGQVGLGILVAGSQITLYLRRKTTGTLLLAGAGLTILISVTGYAIATLQGDPYTPFGTQSPGFFGWLLAALMGGVGFAALQMERVMGGFAGTRIGNTGDTSNSGSANGDFTLDVLSELARERQTLLAQLERAARLTETGMFSASLAHELGQPLQSIAAKAHLAAAEVCSRFGGSQAPEDRALVGLVDDIVAQSSRASQIIRGLRALYAENISNRVELNPLVLAREAASLVHNAPGRTSMTVEARATTDDPLALMVSGDRIQLQLVFYNVFANAARALNGRSDPKVQVDARPDGDDVVLTFRDNGPGLPDDLLGDVQVFRPARGESGGMGVGLLLCRTIVERHGGALLAENAPEGGAQITVRLPKIQREASSTSAH